MEIRQHREALLNYSHMQSTENYKINYILSSHTQPVAVTTSVSYKNSPRGLASQICLYLFQHNNTTAIKNTHTHTHTYKKASQIPLNALHRNQTPYR